MRRLARLAALWLPPLLLMALIFALSSVPSDDVDRGALYFITRKLLHFAEYALLLLLWWRALQAKLTARLALATAFVIAVGFAASDELLQRYVDGRVGTPVDVAIDAAGAAAAAWLIMRRRDVREEVRAERRQEHGLH